MKNDHVRATAAQWCGELGPDDHHGHLTSDAFIDPARSEVELGGQGRGIVKRGNRWPPGLLVSGVWTSGTGLRIRCQRHGRWQLETSM